MSRLASIVKVPAALVMSTAVSLLSCYGASAVIGATRFGASDGLPIVRVIAPFVVAGMVGGWAFYLLMVGERPELRSRRARRVAQTGSAPRPRSVALMCLALVFGVVGVWLFGLTSLLGPDGDGWAGLFALIALGSAVLFGVPLALFVGIGAALARARTKRESGTDLSP